MEPGRTSDQDAEGKAQRRCSKRTALRGRKPLTDSQLQEKRDYAQEVRQAGNGAFARLRSSWPGEKVVDGEFRRAFLRRRNVAAEVGFLGNGGTDDGARQKKSMIS